jgi:hypothetical protein
MLFDKQGFICDRRVQWPRVKRKRPLGKRRENLEGLWGELASSFTNLGVSREATLLMHSLQPTDETCLKIPGCDGISWILRFAFNSFR